MKGKKILNIALLIVVSLIAINNTEVHAEDIINSVSYLDVESSASSNILDSNFISSNGSMDKFIKKDGNGYALFTDKADLYSDVYFDIIYLEDNNYVLKQNVVSGNVFKSNNDYVIMLPITRYFVPKDLVLDNIYAVRLASLSRSDSSWFDLRVSSQQNIYFDSFTSDYHGHEEYVSNANMDKCLTDRHIVVDSNSLPDFDPSSLFYLFDDEDGIIDINSNSVESSYDYNKDDQYLKLEYNYTLSVKDSKNNITTEKLLVHVLDTQCPITLAYNYYVPKDFDLNLSNLKDILMIKDDFSRPENCTWSLSDPESLEEFTNCLLNKQNCAYDIKIFDESGNSCDDTLGFNFLEDTNPNVYINKLCVTEEIYNTWTQNDLNNNMLTSIQTVYPSALSCQIVEETMNPENNTVNIVYSVNTDKGSYVNFLTVLKDTKSGLTPSTSIDNDSIANKDNVKLVENESTSKGLIIKVICISVSTLCLGIAGYMLIIKKK